MEHDNNVVDGFRFNFQEGLSDDEKICSVISTRKMIGRHLKKEIFVTVIQFASAAAAAILLSMTGCIPIRALLCMVLAVILLSGSYGLYLVQQRKDIEDITEPCMILCGIGFLIFAFLSISDGNILSSILAAVMLPLLMNAIQNVDDILYRRRVIAACQQMFFRLTWKSVNTMGPEEWAEANAGKRKTEAEDKEEDE